MARTSEGERPGAEPDAAAASRSAPAPPQEAAIEASVQASDHPDIGVIGVAAEPAASAATGASVASVASVASEAAPPPEDPAREPAPTSVMEAMNGAGSEETAERVAEPDADYAGWKEPERRPASRPGKARPGAGWPRILRRGASAAIAAFIPPLCLHCEGRRFGDLPLCMGCVRKLAPARGLACARCGSADCADSHSDWPHPFGAVHALFKVTPPLSTLVHGFKYRHQRRNIDFLCAFLRYRPDLQEAIRGADALVPVPLHPVRRRERGYNQAEAIAAALGTACGRPVLAGVLRRLRKTGTQTRLSREERLRNLGGAFVCAEPGEVQGRRILLVDDVFTTGATATGCADALMRSGCTSVAVIALGKVEKAEAADDFVAEMEAVASYLA
jgi:ComF family protein